MSPEAKEGQPIRILPLTVEAVNPALASIALNPDGVTWEEGEILKHTNPGLNIGLHSTLESHKKVGHGTYVLGNLIEGALWTHRIIRAQAEVNGTSIPRLTSDETLTYLRDEVERIPSESDLSTADDNEAEFSRIGSEDTVFRDAVLTMTAYRSSRTYFYAGATLVYKLVKKATEKLELERIYKI